MRRSGGAKRSRRRSTGSSGHLVVFIMKLIIQESRHGCRLDYIQRPLEKERKRKVSV